MNQTFLGIVISRQIVSEISPSKAFSLLAIKPSLLKTILRPHFCFCLYYMAGIDNLEFQIEHLGKKNLILSHLYIKYQ